MKEDGLMRNIMKDSGLKTPIAVCIALLLLVFPLHSIQAQPISNNAETLMQKGDSCRLDWKYKIALNFYEQAYDDAVVTNDVDMQIESLVRVMRTHDVLRHWKEMPESSYRLYVLATEHGDSVHAAMALVMRGKRLHSLGQKQEGLRVVKDATEMMERTVFPHKNHELADCYAILAKMYCSDGRYDEAMQMSQKQEHYVKLSKGSHTDEWYRRNLQRTFIIRLEILSKMGRLDEADRIYKKNGIVPVTDPLCGDALLIYYRYRGMHVEALRFLNAAMENIREDGDTIGRNMQRLMNDMGNVYYGLGDYQQAAECYAGTSRIADSLAARSLSNLIDEVHKVIDSERSIAKYHERHIIIIASAVVLLVFILLMLRQYWVVRRKNKRMMGLIRQMTGYREVIIHNGDSDEMGNNMTSDVPLEEYKRFKEVDKRIMKEHLFANPEFGREDLMRLLGVDKNRLPKLIHSIAGTNVPGYINSKRMEYAVTLLNTHTDYTFEAIAEACGISPTTFIRNFKAAYDMTPSDYRKQLKDASIASHSINN